jgi:hypothetical protein
MTFANFLGAQYLPAPGCAVPLAKIAEQCPDFRSHLDSRFPIGIFCDEAHVGNLSGEGSVIVADRELICEFGRLMPRDLRSDEFAEYRRHTKFFQPRTRTLTRTQMTVRGWNRRVLSRAERMAGMKESDY